MKRKIIRITSMALKLPKTTTLITSESRFCNQIKSLTKRNH